jgi:mono/diheme cytochrome c family protein
MKKNKYLLLLSSLGVLALLVIAAAQENFGREWRRIQAQGTTDDGRIAVQLRQIVNPALGASDRCVSCHVAMAPGEQSVTGSKLLAAHKPVVHDPAEFGCSVCHGGQGQATEKHDAHGDVEFWPAPMLPAKYSYAGCGTCHVALGVPERERLHQARLTFERLDCLACHRVDGRGGTIRPGGGGMEGPDLSAAGLAGYDRGWYEKHVESARKADAGPWKTSFGPATPEERELLALYLNTRAGTAELIEAKAAFFSTGCLGCHKVSGVGGDDGPELSRAGEKDPGQMSFAGVPGEATVPNWIQEHFRSPLALVAESQMPALRETERTLDLLTLYVLSLRRRDLPASYAPKDRVRALRFEEREFAADGATIFGAFCSGCHGADGMGRRSPGMAAFPSIANPDFQQLVTDEFLRETIRRGRPGRRMPAWGEMTGGLRASEIDEAVRHLRSLSGVPEKKETGPARWVVADAGLGERLYAASCAGCHGRNGEGGEGPALNNPVLLGSATDRYFIETISNGRRGTPMAGFAAPSVTRPAYAAAEIEAIVAFLRTWGKEKK